MEGYQQGEEMGKHKWQVQKRQGEVKNSIGNVEGKENCTCMYNPWT